MKAIRFFMFAVVAAAALAAGTLAYAAACDVVVITEDDIARQAENTPPTKNWVLYTRNAGTGAFVAGPSAPPSGIGSLNTVTPTGADKVYLFNYDYVGTPLSAIDQMSYSTYRDSGASPNQVPALNIQVDFNGAAPGGFTTLVFEPVYNTNQGAIVDDTWQTWDAYAGGQAIWWSSQSIPGVCAFNCFVTWNQILASNPDATIGGGFGINQGSGNPALNANSDELTISVDGNCVTYDFEPYEVATDKETCKNGGWKSLRRADGTPFKNQGDCIQFVNTGK